MRAANVSLLVLAFLSMVLASTPQVILTLPSDAVAGNVTRVFITVMHDEANANAMHYINRVVLYVDDNLVKEWNYTQAESPEQSGRFPSLSHDMVLSEGVHKIKATAECSSHGEAETKAKEITIVKSADQLGKNAGLSTTQKSEGNGLSIVYYFLFIIIAALFIAAIMLLIQIKALGKRQRRLAAEQE